MAGLSEYGDVHALATGGQQPYAYQKRVALEGLPELLEAPTGAGKTSIALAWLYRRRFHPDPDVRQATPHWLVFCLPMRVLVEQVLGEVGAWVERVGLTDDVGVHAIMGGDGIRARPWRYDPGQDAIFVGTLDMLLSRALNRGYGDSRFLWPVDFGLLNSSTHWVFDEVQLMGPALPTSRQLQGLRDRLGTTLPTSSTWMSATVDVDALATFDRPGLQSIIRIGDEDRSGTLGARLAAPKRVRRLDIDPKRPMTLAGALIEHHRPGARTLAILNTVDRAADTARELRKAAPEAEVVLIHSRFRPPDRKRVLDAALAPPPPAGTIVVSTQVVEAGVDISAAVLFTEAAPWPSIVQRAGRCNRFGELGEDDEPTLLWAAPPRPEPYEQVDVDAAGLELASLEGAFVTPDSLGSRTVPTEPVIHPVLRMRDLLDLFDTLPDLTDNDIDVSRFIRDADDLDAQVAWWDLSGGPPPDGASLPTRDERCPVPVAALRKALPDSGAWRMDHLSGRWERCRQRDIRPGLVVVLDVKAGMYDPDVGWDPKARGPVPPVPGEPLAAVDGDQAVGDNAASVESRWYALAQHLLDTEREAALLVEEFGHGALPPEHAASAQAAARLHDIGKAHPEFQGMLRSCAGDEPAELARADAAGYPLAKSGGPGRGRYEDTRRRPFRHELASALSLLAGAHPSLDDGADADLVAYLVAAHHGRVRLGFRPLPDETGEDIALGVIEGDEVPLDEIEGFGLNRVTLSLKPMQLGGPEGRSWADLALRLRDRDDLGPFRLGMLEALVRIADWRASRAIEPKKADAHA